MSLSRAFQEPFRGFFSRQSTQVQAVQAINMDAFERDRVSNPATVFDCKLQYDEQPLIMDTATTGAGAIAHDAEGGLVEMTVGTGSGDEVIRQSRQYCVYQPGKSQLVYVTGVMGERVEGRRQRIGYFDAENGIFFEQTGEGLFVVLRSSVTGTTIDTRIPQSEWNMDRLDGLEPTYSPSKNTPLDVTKSQIFTFDLEWLGVGRVRAGLNMNGQGLLAHQFLNDNRIAFPYWTTATLPVRYEITNTAATDTPGTMKQICCSVQSEGGLDLNKGFSFSQFNTAVVNNIPTGSFQPILSIRPKTTFRGITNRTGVIQQSMDIMAFDAPVLVEIVYNGTLTGASWADVDAESAVEWDQSATAVTGGTVIYRSFVDFAGGGNDTARLHIEGLPNILWLTNNIAGNATTPVTVRCQGLSQNADVIAALRWTEVR